MLESIRVTQSDREQGLNELETLGLMRPANVLLAEYLEALTAEDVRFTTKGNALYAFMMGWPTGSALIKPLGSASPQAPGKIANVELLGYKGKLEWSQTETGLSVTMPRQQPSQHAVTLKVALA